MVKPAARQSPQLKIEWIAGSETFEIVKISKV